MQTARYLSHPQVLIDPGKDVPKWSLSEIGHARVERFVMRIAREGILSDTKLVVSSAETKAVETAQPIADILRCTFVVNPLMHENDRSATGFLKPDEFEHVADQFFAFPKVSTRGWETAQNAQGRILRQVSEIVSTSDHGDVLFVGHGGVGTLLYCALSGNEIDRKFDQSASNSDFGKTDDAKSDSGGGNYFSFDMKTNKALHRWHAMEGMK